MWREFDVVASQGVELAREILTDTVQTFAGYADDETLRHVPRHAYFLDPRPDLPARACD